MKTESSLAWLRSNLRYLRVSEIEISIGCPRNSLQKYLKEGRSLKQEWVDKLGLFIEELNNCMVVEKSLGDPQLDGYSIPRPMIGGIINPSDHFDLIKVEDELIPLLEKKKRVKKVVEKFAETLLSKQEDMPIEVIDVVNDNFMAMVDVNTGEMFDDFTKYRWEWNKPEGMKMVEPFIYSDGKTFSVLKRFGPMDKYVNNLKSIDEAKAVHNKFGK